MPNARELLKTKEIAVRLSKLGGWSLKDAKLHREYRFDDFVHAFAFMSACALHAESMKHHPEWFNVWNKVTVDLNTHDAGGITELDFLLAEKMEITAGKLGAK